MPFSFDQFREKSVPQISAVAAIIIFFIFASLLGYLTLGKSALTWEESIPKLNSAPADFVRRSLFLHSDLFVRFANAIAPRTLPKETIGPDVLETGNGNRSHFGRRLGVQWVSRSSARLAPTAWRQSKKSKRLK
jgi:hypothetical protein